MTVLQGQFEETFDVDLDDEIGRGGIAVVFRGVNQYSGEVIAAKRPLDRFRHDEHVLRRFTNESRMNSFVSPHPQVVRWVDYVEDGPWIVMEYLDGQDLKKIIRDRGPLPLNEAVHYLTQVAAALDHLHERWVAHLDITPRNLFIDTRRRLKLIDFGLTQTFAQQQDTIGEHLFGTAAYMAPEQADFKPIGGFTDIYSLGCVFHEMVTGAPPFVVEGLSSEDEQLALLEMHRHAEPVPPSKARPDLNLPVWVDDVVGRAMEKQPDHRFPSAAAFAEAAQWGHSGRRSRPATPSSERLPVETILPPTVHQPSEADDVDASSDEERGPGLGRRAWNAGGRRLQNSTHVRAIVWKLSLLAAIVALVATLNVASNGSLTELASLGVQAGPAITVQVANDGNRVRAEPNTTSEIFTTVSTDDTVEIIGLPVERPDYEWWPVKVEVEGTTVKGWIHSEALKKSSWMQVLGFPDQVSDGFDKITGWWP